MKISFLGLGLGVLLASSCANANTRSYYNSFREQLTDTQQSYECKSESVQDEYFYGRPEPNGVNQLFFVDGEFFYIFLNEQGDILGGYKGKSSSHTPLTSNDIQKAKKFMTKIFSVPVTCTPNSVAPF